MACGPDKPRGSVCFFLVEFLFFTLAEVQGTNGAFLIASFQISIDGELIYRAVLLSLCRIEK